MGAVNALGKSVGRVVHLPTVDLSRPNGQAASFPGQSLLWLPPPRRRKIKCGQHFLPPLRRLMSVKGVRNRKALLSYRFLTFPDTFVPPRAPKRCKTNCPPARSSCPATTTPGSAISRPSSSPGPATPANPPTRSTPRRTQRLLRSRMSAEPFACSRQCYADERRRLHRASRVSWPKWRRRQRLTTARNLTQLPLPE
jgi:hypothetical protein